MTKKMLLLIMVLIYINCQDEPAPEVNLCPDEVTLTLDIDFSEMLENQNYSDVSHFQLFIEDTTDPHRNIRKANGPMYEISKTFYEDVCLEISQLQFDSLYLGFRLIKNQTPDMSKDPFIFFKQSISENNTIALLEKIKAIDLWARPECNEVSIRIINEDEFTNSTSATACIEGAAGICVQMSLSQNSTIEGLIESGLDHNLPYYDINFMPCSTLTLRFYK